MEFPRIPNSLFLQQGEEVATLSSKLPEEIYQEILIRLPVKSVLINGDTSELTTSLEIFSLKSNAWETILTPYWSAYGEWKTGVLVNGNLHWLAKGECGGCIVYLDISYGMPSFKEIQLPTVQNLEFFSVGVLEEGCLCVLADNGDIGLARVEVWEMQVYGVRESWTRRYVIANHTITTSVMVEESGWRTIWSFKKGKIIFVDSQKVVLYDPKHRTAIERNLNRLAYFTSVVNHVESLVSLSSGTYVGQN
ncbi:uncharacterized protein LOC113309135 isoform X2 [Papaver somniferum]|uniref:uncharacterized protein LOC113309135 isoform X2 n=1 Tax=Papaver somniferum TaxID=3469 RepID=UPI000E6FA51A|nr:uncharacterized protein LOC113309135 isoform X2 [Papaver somniferum]